MTETTLHHNELSVEEICGSQVSQEQFQKLVTLCAQAQSEWTTRNWAVDNWESTPESLLHCLLKEGRFSGERGRLFLLSWQGNPVACSGVYRAPWNAQFALGGVRTFTAPKERLRWAKSSGTFFHSDYLLPAQFRWAQQQGCFGFGLTFNDETLRLLHFLQRLARGEAISLGLRPTEQSMQFYAPFVLHPTKVPIQFVDQYLYYRRISSPDAMPMPAPNPPDILEGLL